MSRVVVNEIEAKVGNDITFNDTVKIDTIKGKTTAGSVTVQGEGTNTTNLQQGLCKSWIHFEGDGTVAITDSFNVTTLTDNNDGDYSYTFTNNMNNANYSVVLTHEHGDAGGQTSNAYFQTIATGSFISHNEGVSSGSNTNHGARDFAVCGAVLGDLVRANHIENKYRKDILKNLSYCKKE